MTESEHHLTVLMEECGELTQACAKVIRFGTTIANFHNLVKEFNDVVAMAELLGLPIDRQMVLDKKAKVHKYKRVSEEIKGKEYE